MCGSNKHTRQAGVEHQTGLGGLQQPLDEAAGEDGRGEDDGPLGLDLHWLHHTVGDQVVLMAWLGREVEESREERV